MTRHLIHAGTSVRSIDDRNALVIHEGCGHTDAIARQDDQPLSPCDLGELSGLPCQTCRDWEKL